MIREKLINVEEMFESVRGDKEKTREMVDDITDKAVEEFATNIAPESWAKARDKLREYIRNLIRENVEEVVDKMLLKMEQEIENIIDIDDLMEEVMLEDRGLMGHVLLKVASPEFRLIERSGLYFGFLFGVVQMLLWIIYPVNWVLPAAGFLVGYATNWVAMKLIFEPVKPKKIGPFILQGLFIKRQFEAAEQFSDVICDKVFTSDNFARHMSSGEPRKKLIKIIDEQLEESMAIYEEDPMVAMLASPEKLAEAKQELKDRLHTSNFEDNEFSKNFSGDTQIIRKQIHEKLKELDESEFSDVLRPVFQKDEWKLLLTGGVLGGIIGFLQVVYIFGGTF
jgi:uncharacterized membrane protein YheB (UPF0754 family)